MTVAVELKRTDAGAWTVSVFNQTTGANYARIPAASEADAESAARQLFRLLNGLSVVSSAMAIDITEWPTALRP